MLFCNLFFVRNFDALQIRFYRFESIQAKHRSFNTPQTIFWKCDFYVMQFSNTPNADYFCEFTFISEVVAFVICFFCTTVA